MAKVFVGLHAHFGIPLKICVKPSIVKIKKVSTSVSFGCVTSGPPKLSCCKRWCMCSCLCGLPRQFWLVGVGGLGGPHAGLGGSAGWLKAGVSPLQVCSFRKLMMVEGSSKQEMETLQTFACITFADVPSAKAGLRGKIKFEEIQSTP